jgi:DNA-binding IclR family transcriptional regulator
LTCCGSTVGVFIALYRVDGSVAFTDLRRALDLPNGSFHVFLDGMSRVGLVECRRAVTDLGVGAVV